MRVLIVDDDAEVRSVLTRALERDGHVATTAASLAEARLALEDGADLLVLDQRLPDGEGLALCRELRAEGATTPVLLLTAHSQVSQRVEGFEAGADDFLAKPFAIAELRLRVRALGRRSAQARPTVFSAGEVKLDFAGRRAEVAGQRAALTSTEWAILEVLAARQGRVVARLELLESVWGEAGTSAENSLQVLVGRLRRKLGAELIHTLRGEGYALGSQGLSG